MSKDVNGNRRDLTRKRSRQQRVRLVQDKELDVLGGEVSAHQELEYPACTDQHTRNVIVLLPGVPTMICVEAMDLTSVRISMPPMYDPTLMGVWRPMPAPHPVVSREHDAID